MFAWLALGVLVVSLASLLIRLAQAEGAGSLAIASGRLLLAALVLTPLAWKRCGAELRRLPRRDWATAGAAGVLLALHFATWIASLRYTSVANSVALVTTNPIWVGLGAWLFLRERPAAAVVAGIGMSIAGAGLIFLSDTWAAGGAAAPGAPAVEHGAPLLGNLLALAGAVAISGYLLVGRALSRNLSLLAYVWIVYAATAAVLLVAAIAAGTPPWDMTGAALLAVAALALGPQLTGHTILNWSLRRLSAAFVAVAILGEPIGSALLAWLFLGEGFTALQGLGFALLMAGIFVAARAERAG
ncbi:MAG: DMT family transporter [Burkholderiales bacterium]|nr:MAG: DMT family transporter [Burkholderiales bacterium]